MFQTFDEYVRELVAFVIKYEPMDPLALNCKAAEEFGELSEQLLYNNGYVQHKTMKEPIECEFGDVLNCIIASIAKTLHNQGCSEEEIVQRLLNGANLKFEKYLKIINDLP